MPYFQTQYHALKPNGEPYHARDSQDFSGKFSTQSKDLGAHIRKWETVAITHFGAALHGTGYGCEIKK